MTFKKKTLKEYEDAARQEGECLILDHGNGARHIYQLRHGPLPTHIYVCHICDNPRCIRDEHHFLGTCGDNIRDAVKKGRHACCTSHPTFRGPHTPEARKKISEGLVGRMCSEETRKKISESERGKYVSLSTRRKLSERVVSEETRRKQSEAQQRRYARSK